MGVHVEVEKVRVGYPFAAKMDGPAVKAAMEAMSSAYETDAGFMGSGGSIPLWPASESARTPRSSSGAEDVAQAKIHASNESVDLNEIERLIVAQALTCSGGGADSRPIVASTLRSAIVCLDGQSSIDQAIREPAASDAALQTAPPSTTATGEKR